MNLRQLQLSRRSIAVCVAVAGTVSLAIGAHAALNKRMFESPKGAVAAGTTGSIPSGASRLALIIGNGHPGRIGAAGPADQRCPHLVVRAAPRGL